MKIMTILAILLFQIQAFACQCEGPSFSKEDADQAVLNFMQSKVMVTEDNIFTLELEYTKGFLTFLQARVLDMMQAHSSQDLSCERECGKSMNSKYKYLVTYKNSEGQNCLQELFVKMKSNTFTRGFKSKVKKEIMPVCE